MGSEAETTATEAKTETAAPSAAEKPAAPAAKAEPKTEAKAEPKTEPKTEKTSAKDDAKESAKDDKPSAFQLGEDDDDVPEETAAKLLQLSPTALKKRLDRHTKRELLDSFGTTDAGEIKAKLEKLAAFEAKAEEERLAQLTETQRLSEEAKKEKERADKAEKAYQKAIDAQAFATYDSAAEKAIEKHFGEDADIREFAMDRLKKHILSLDDSDLKNPTKVFEAWAEKYTKEHPKYAKAAPAAPPPPKEIALTTGSNPNRPEKSPVDMAKKTARPGQANSMSKAEYAEWKRQRQLA